MSFKKLLTLMLVLSSSVEVMAASCCSGGSASDTYREKSEKDEKGGMLGDLEIKKSNISFVPYGELDFQYAHRMQDGLPEGTNLSNNQKNFMFFSRAKVGVKVEAQMENNISYGAKVALSPLTRSKMNNSYIFVKSDMGELQLGSGRSVDAEMKVDAYDVGPGGCAWTRYAFLDLDDKKKINYFESDTQVLDDYIVPDAGGENSRKISYLSPEFNGLSMGVSYAPDTQNTGSDGLKSKKETNDKVDHPAKNAFALALLYKHTINEDLNFKVSVTGATATAMQTLDSQGKPDPTKEKHGITTFTIGGVVNVSNFSIGGSYSDWGKSLENKVKTPNIPDPDNLIKSRKSYYYTAGIGYKAGPVAVSFIYFNGTRQDNKLQSYTIGSDYKVAPGFTPYFEVTRFSTKGRVIDTGTAATATMPAIPVTATASERKGTVVTLGTKISF